MGRKYEYIASCEYLMCIYGFFTNIYYIPSIRKFFTFETTPPPSKVPMIYQTHHCKCNTFITPLRIEKVCCEVSGLRFLYDLLDPNSIFLLNKMLDASSLHRQIQLNVISFYSYKVITYNL